MAEISVSLEELYQAREKLISDIKTNLSDTDKKFLISLKSGEPEWNLIPVANIDKLNSYRIFNPSNCWFDSISFRNSTCSYFRSYGRSLQLDCYNKAEAAPGDCLRILVQGSGLLGNSKRPKESPSESTELENILSFGDHK